MEKVFKRFVPEDSFSWMNMFMKYFCLSPPDTKILRSMYDLLSPPFFLIVLGVPLVCEPLQVFLSDDSVERKLLTVGIFNLHFTSIVRAVTWFRIRKEFEGIVEVVKRPTFEFGIFDVTDVERSQQGGITRVDKNGANRSPIPAYQEEINFKTSCICFLGYFSFFFYVNFNFLVSYTINYHQDTYEKFNPYLNKTSAYRDFVYPIWFPFDYSVSDGHYFLAFIYEPVGYYILVGGFITADWMIINTVTHLKHQLTVIAFALTQVDRNIPAKERRTKTKSLQEMRIVKCIQELQIISGLAKQLDSLINVTVLFTFLCSLFILCCLSYLASVLSTSFQISLFASMFGATLIENFVVCWFFQAFTLEFSIISKNVYDLDWVNYPPRLRRMLIFLMAMVQKPPTFTLFRWTKIDMLLFINVVKMASSFYTLISNINSK